MSAYRPLGQFPQYFLADGSVNNGGLITFYETDLTTLKDTYSDEGLTTLNANPVVMDSGGRPETDIWGSDEYGVVITDSLGANARTFNNIQPDSGAGASLPSLVSGDFLTNNGSVLQWDSVSQVPDPTGETGKFLSTDGVNFIWVAGPVTPTLPTTVSATSLQVDDSTSGYNIMIQTGSSSATASGGSSATASVTFGTAFSSILHVGITQTSIATVSNGAIPCQALSSLSTTGFTVKFLVVVDTSNPAWNIVSNVPFTWYAIGLVP